MRYTHSGIVRVLDRKDIHECSIVHIIQEKYGLAAGLLETFSAFKSRGEYFFETVLIVTPRELATSILSQNACRVTYLKICWTIC